MVHKSTKSLQNTLNDFKEKLLNISQKTYKSITAGAYTKARSKLNYTAFIELYQFVRDQFYEDGDYHTYQGFRLLAIDGSKIILPDSEDVKKVFTPTVAKNQKEDFSKEVVQARASVLYDVCNHIVIDATLRDKAYGERALAIKHLQYVQKGDLIIFDRGYPSVELFGHMFKRGVDFIVRLRRNSFKKAAFMFDPSCQQEDVTIKIKAPAKLKPLLRRQGLLTTMIVRFVRVVLDNGEIEVLATSVLDHARLQTEAFKDLYYRRWGIETFYNVLKNRLSLENFTGISALAVQQDFYVTMFLSNYESLLAYDINEDLKQKSKNNKHLQKVNKAISFNTIKQKSFELFYSKKEIETILEEMKQLFLTSPTLVRTGRIYKKRLDKMKNKSTVYTNSANFQKRKKKVI